MSDPAQKPIGFQDKGFFRRKFPRRLFKRKIGVLIDGHFVIAESEEIGEGGMALRSEFVFEVGKFMVLSFQIPQGDFISLRVEVKSIRKRGSQSLHGISFISIQFSQKRQIRSFVSSRGDNESLIF